MTTPAPQTSARRDTFARPVILAAAIVFAYWGVLARLGRFWWEDDNYSHGLLIPFIIGYIVWTKWDEIVSAPKRPLTMLGGLMVASALLALWVGTAGAEQFTQRMSLVLLLAGAALYFWGVGLLKLLAVPLALLVLAIPIPSILFNKVAFPLQLFASRCAVWAMRQFDIPVLREGNVIELLPLGSATTKKLEVVEACSGIRSLMTLVTLAVVFAYFTSPDDRDTPDGRRRPFHRRYSFWRALLIVGAAVPIAIITNAGRVSGTGVLARYYGTEVADGFFHTFSGWVVYIVAFLLLFAFGWLIDRFNPERRGPGGGGGGARATARDATVEASAAKDEGVPDGDLPVGATPRPAMSVGRTDAGLS
ncbi:MAG TPA: exosortase/archaeosortase family protein [Pyrinomonadaceae bacterium]|nr:exosortase/archaeosortase family protein [Pyrinomonadaceae bacterium]